MQRARHRSSLPRDAADPEKADGVQCLQRSPYLELADSITNDEADNTATLDVAPLYDDRYLCVENGRGLSSWDLSVPGQPSRTLLLDGHWPQRVYVHNYRVILMTDSGVDNVPHQGSRVQLLFDDGGSAHRITRVDIMAPRNDARAIALGMAEYYPD